MIEEQRGTLRGDPEREAKAWLERLAALGRKRGGYLDLAAEGIMDRVELRAKLARLQVDRETAEREIAAIEGRREWLEQMEHNRDAVMEHYAGTVPDSLDDLSPEERHRIYRMLRLEVLAYPDKSLEVSGAILAGRGRAEWREIRRRRLQRSVAQGIGLGVLEPTRGFETRPYERSCDSSHSSSTLSLTPPVLSSSSTASFEASLPGLPRCVASSSSSRTLSSVPPEPARRSRSVILSPFRSTRVKCSTPDSCYHAA